MFTHTPLYPDAKHRGILLIKNLLFYKLAANVSLYKTITVLVTDW